MSHAVRPVVAERDGVEAGHDVGVEVALAADLVEELRGDGAAIDPATRARVLGDDGRAVGRDLRDREAGVAQVGDLGEEGVVAAGGLRAALDHVPGHAGAGQSVPVVSGPAVHVQAAGADHDRGIGHPAGDHDVDSGAERLDDAPAAEVGVGGDRGGATVSERFAGVEVGQRVSGGDELVEPAQQVVAGDHADAGGQAEPVRHLRHRLGAAGRVEPAGVGDDLDAAFEAGAHDLLHLGHERAGVAASGPLGLRAGEDEHRELGQPVAREEVDRAALDHLPCGRHAVPVEAGAVGDADGGGHVLTLWRGLMWRGLMGAGVRTRPVGAGRRPTMMQA